MEILILSHLLLSGLWSGHGFEHVDQLIPEIRSWQTKHDEVDSRIDGNSNMSNISDSVDQLPVCMTREHLETSADTLDGEKK